MEGGGAGADLLGANFSQLYGFCRSNGSKKVVAAIVFKNETADSERNQTLSFTVSCFGLKKSAHCNQVFGLF